MGDWFGRLPQSECEVESTTSGANAYYFRPAIDGSRGGVFFMNVSEPEGWGRYEIESMSYHEGMPGHHLQLAIARSSTTSPTSARARSSRPTARAGAFTRSGSPTRWASTSRRSTGWACWRPTRCAPAGWSSTPDCTARAGRDNRRSTTWSPTAEDPRARHRRDRPVRRHARPGAVLHGRPARDAPDPRARGSGRASGSTSRPSTTPCSSQARCRSRCSRSTWPADSREEEPVEPRARHGRRPPRNRHRPGRADLRLLQDVRDQLAAELARLEKADRSDLRSKSLRSGTSDMTTTSVGRIGSTRGLERVGDLAGVGIPARRDV